MTQPTAESIASSVTETDEIDVMKPADEVEEEEEAAPEAVDESGLPENVKAILKKERDATRAAQQQARRLERSLQEKDKPAEDSEPDPNVAKFRGLFVKQAAKSEFLAAGLTGQPDRLIRMLDMDEIDVSDDGEVTGLKEQIEDIKADFPDLFADDKPKRKAPRVAGSPRPAGNGAAKSSADLISARLTGSAR